MANDLGKNRILYVEDEDDLRDLMSEWLVRQGYEVKAFPSAEDALDALRDRSIDADIVVTDFLLPGMNGLELAKAVIDEGLVDGADRIIITSATPPRKEAAALGVGVLLKPVNLPRLVEAIEQHLWREKASASERPRLTLVKAVETPARAIAQLVLWVSRDSIASRKALGRLRRLASRLGTAVVDLEVREVESDPDAAESDRIAFTPTLIRRRPLPAMRLIGDLGDHAALENLLDIEDETPPSTGTD